MRLVVRDPLLTQHLQRLSLPSAPWGPLGSEAPSRSASSGLVIRLIEGARAQKLPLLHLYRPSDHHISETHGPHLTKTSRCLSPFKPPLPSFSYSFIFSSTPRKPILEIIAPFSNALFSLFVSFVSFDFEYKSEESPYFPQIFPQIRKKSLDPGSRGCARIADFYCSKS